MHCDHRIDIIRKWWLIRAQQCLLNLKLAIINSFETLFNEISEWNLRVWMSLVYSSWKLLNAIPKFRQTWCNLVEHMGFVVYMFQRFEREFCNISLLWPGWCRCDWCFFVSRLMTSVKQTSLVKNNYFQTTVSISKPFSIVFFGMQIVL